MVLFNWEITDTNKLHFSESRNNKVTTKIKNEGDIGDLDSDKDKRMSIFLDDLGKKVYGVLNPVNVPL